MKNTVLTLMAIGLSTLAFAADPTSKMAVIGEQKTGKFKVIYEGVAVSKVTLKIYDSNGHEIFAETIKGLSKFMRPLSFEGLDRGEYTIEITDENGKQIQKVNYTATIVEETTETSITAFHVYKMQDGKYLVSANEGTGKINIRIFDNNNNLLHTEYRPVNKGFGVVYNLKEVSGKPVFMITDAAGKDYTIK